MMEICRGQHGLEAGKLEPFPHRSRLGGGVKNEDNFDVYCVCRMPEMHSVPMIECTRCSKWFHSCVEVSLNNSVYPLESQTGALNSSIKKYITG